MVSTLLGSDITITYGEQAWSITPDELSQALVVPVYAVNMLPELDTTALHSLLGPITAEVSGPPMDAPLMHSVDVNAEHGEYGFRFTDSDDPDDPRDSDWLT